MDRDADALLSIRPPEVVMDPARAAAVVPGPLSFTRQAMRALVHGRARVQRLRFDLDAEGRGEVLYRLSVGGWDFHFFCLSNKLPEDQKTDRNYAASWDAMGVLCQGEWTAEREAWLRREVPRQRAGYADYDTLVYARGNRSARLFDHVVDCLAAGRQPDPAELAPVGYILRTTAFIGNGQLGTRPLAGFEPDHPLRRPYQVQFTSAFVLREFLFDLVEHIARARSPHAARLAPAFRRFIGLGNSAATGLIWFIVNHPHLMHEWSLSRERALARVLAQPVLPGDEPVQRALALLDKAARHHDESHAAAADGNGTPAADDAASRIFTARNALARDLRQAREVLAAYAASGCVAGKPVQQPWRTVSDWAAQHLGPEAVEVVHAVWLELHPEIVDDVAPAAFTPETVELQPAMPLAALRALLRQRYAWVNADPVAGRSAHHFWYRTTLTPRDTRRAPRGREPAFEHETTMDTVLQVQRLWQALDHEVDDPGVARFVARHPDLRHIVARVQALAGLDYAEMREQWLAREFAPFGAVRFVLHFFGVEKFEAALPKSVRGTFMQGAPVAEDVAAGRDGDWPFVLRPDPARSDERQAPASAVTDAPDPVPRGPVLLREPLQRSMAPGELARLVAAALQGHGAPLGAAEAAADMVVHRQSLGEPAVQAVLEQCCEGRWRGLPAAWDFADDASGDRLQAHGSAALRWAADAADLAVARALVPARAAAPVVVRDVQAPEMAAPAVLRCARAGLLALMTWTDASAGIARRGWSAAGPGPEGPWWVTVADGDPPAAVAAHLGAAHRLAPQPTGFALWSRPCGSPTHGEALRAEATQAARDTTTTAGAALAFDSGALHAHALHMQRRGVAIGVEVLDRLTAASATVLVPHEHEHRVLDAGFDPLKAF